MGRGKARKEGERKIDEEEMMLHCYHENEQFINAIFMDTGNKLKVLFENEARLCSKVVGGGAPPYAFKMWGGSLAIKWTDCVGRIE